MFLLGLGIILSGFLFIDMLLAYGNYPNFFDLGSFMVILPPIAGVLIATKSFGVFFAGLRAAILPKEEITEEMRGRAASLFRLLSKVAVMSGAMCTLVSFVNLLMNMNFSDTGGWASFCFNVAIALLSLLYGLLLVVAVFEPVVFILKKRAQKQR